MLLCNIDYYLLYHSLHNYVVKNCDIVQRKKFEQKYVVYVLDKYHDSLTMKSYIHHERNFIISINRIRALVTVINQYSPNLEMFGIDSAVKI